LRRVGFVKPGVFGVDSVIDAIYQKINPLLKNSFQEEFKRCGWQTSFDSIGTNGTRRPQSGKFNPENVLIPLKAAYLNRTTRWTPSSANGQTYNSVGFGLLSQA
jgi:hypothetical protein